MLSVEKIATKGFHDGPRCHARYTVFIWNRDSIRNRLFVNGWIVDKDLATMALSPVSAIHSCWLMLQQDLKDPRKDVAISIPLRQCSCVGSIKQVVFHCIVSVEVQDVPGHPFTTARGRANFGPL